MHLQMTIHEVGVRKAIIREVERYRRLQEEELAAAKLKLPHDEQVGENILK